VTALSPSDCPCFPAICSAASMLGNRCPFWSRRVLSALWELDQRLLRLRTAKSLQYERWSMLNCHRSRGHSSGPEHAST
jgi:hypothetical protein